MNQRHAIAVGLADAILAGPTGSPAFRARMAIALNHDPLWLKNLARAIERHFGAELHYDDRQRLIDFICQAPAYGTGWQQPAKPFIRHYVWAMPAMHPRPAGLPATALPILETSGDLAAWLGLTPAMLLWYADQRNMNRTPGALNHYHYRWVAKRSGGQRLIEQPKEVLATLQRKILRQILDHIPPHSAAHGFRRGHSCLSHASPHCGQAMVLRMDLRDFFATVPVRQVYGLFNSLGYPVAVSRLLAGLCTNRVPQAILDQQGQLTRQTLQSFQQAHLPQGAPTSPALANLCAWRLDLRLAALAASTAAIYTRYADDLAFSGDDSLRRTHRYFLTRAAAIVQEEGFTVHFRKTRAMTAATRQELTGIVVNRHPNTARPDYDRLKAILHNCARFGPATQNRAQHPDFRAHLLGQVQHFAQINPVRGEKLRAWFDQILW